MKLWSISDRWWRGARACRWVEWGLDSKPSSGLVVTKPGFGACLILWCTALMAAVNSAVVRHCLFDRVFRGTSGEARKGKNLVCHSCTERLTIFRCCSHVSFTYVWVSTSGVAAAHSASHSGAPELPQHCNNGTQPSLPLRLALYAEPKWRLHCCSRPPVVITKLRPAWPQPWGSPCPTPTNHHTKRL